MKVLALASYPVEAASTRYRLLQFVEPLAERGIQLDVRPFLDSRLFTGLYRRTQMPRTAIGLLMAALGRGADVLAARRFDVLLVQREAMMFGPPIIEWLMTRLCRRPMALDLDDATYVSYTSPTYGRLGSALKWFSKTDDLIRWATVVTCGNSAIAEYVESKGRRAIIIPTVVDTESFRPATANIERDVPVIGWVGTHSTYQYLEPIFPVLERLASRYRFRLKIIGAGRDEIKLEGVEVENLEWNLQREISDFQSFDIGLYPIVASEWAAGKSGFKSIQYMAVGIPFIVTPVGAAGEIGLQGVTHFCATTNDEWYAALERLLTDDALRARMGESGRRHALANYTVTKQADKLAQALGEAVMGRELMP